MKNAALPKPGVSNTRPARGSNAGRQHQEKFRLKKMYSHLAYFLYLASKSKKILFNFFSMRPARPYLESHAARESLWVWDPWPQLRVSNTRPADCVCAALKLIRAQYLTIFDECVPVFLCLNQRFSTKGLCLILYVSCGIKKMMCNCHNW